MNKAFLFAECGDEVMASIDIGIGSIAYREPYVYGCIVIAPDLQAAWDTVNFEADSLEAWLKPEETYGFGHPEYCSRIAICVHENIQEPSKVIGSHGINPHWLCHYVQFNESIDRAYRYQPNSSGNEWEIWWHGQAQYSGWRKPFMSWVDMQGQYQTDNTHHEDEFWNEVPY